MSDNDLPASPDRKRQLEDESSSEDEDQSRNGRFKRQAVADADADRTAEAVEEGSHPDEEGAIASAVDATAVNDAEVKPITMRAIITMKEAGMIIGKNGKNVAEIRETSGARVTVSENVNGATERVVTIVGPLDTVAKAFALCATKIVEEQQNPGIDDVKSRPLQIRILVPHMRMGSIIGKQGSKIKEIQDASGSKLTATEEVLPQSTERIVIVAGVIDSIHIATYHIGTVLQDHVERSAGTILYKPLPGVITGQVTPRAAGGASSSSAQPRHPHQPAQAGLPQAAMYGQMAVNPYYAQGVAAMPQAYGAYGHQMAAAGTTMTPMIPQGAMTVQQIYIPNEMVGAIIGKGGVKINEIRTRTGCNIKIADPVPGAAERLITVTGMPDANSMALYMLYQRLEMEKQKVRS
ncbi:hypothetical protein BJ741DRAFT_567730 [Chytriomyces cf. hyalinus JEL632]|nr:hypothetical protein BJ741DRAFT_567730 [Chytriomyces cf. hyalinus JEL632]